MTDPQHVPSGEIQARAKAWFDKHAPDRDEITVQVFDHVEFIGCGANLSSVTCPRCQRELDMEWWTQRMDEYEEGRGFVFRPFVAPCCGAALTLQDLVYDWPCGFGRFVMDVMNPNIGLLTEAQVDELARIFECPIRVVYQHI